MILWIQQKQNKQHNLRKEEFSKRKRISVKNKKEREARIQWTTSNHQFNMLVVRQMKKPVIKAFTIDYNPDRYEKGKKIWRV